MKYICLIYSDESANAKPGTPEFGEVMTAYGAFGQLINEKGVHVAGEPLEHTNTATSVRVRDGETHLTDGPFAETKEQLGGFYILDCANLEEALGYAAKIPSATHGTIEVRPLMSIPGLTD